MIHAHFILPRAGTLSSIPGEGKDNPLHYSCLENPTERSLAGYSPWDHKVSDMPEDMCGFVPDDLGFVFNPLTTESPERIAELVDKLSGAVIEAYRSGLISREAAVAELKARGEPYACWTKIT